MPVDTLKQAQQAFAGHIRNPKVNSAPAGVEDRRMGIYRDLFYSNIEGFICGAFPVLRSLCDDLFWHDMVRDFIARHQSKTPYFLEISQEFLAYLQLEREAVNCPDDLPFMLELAHYEWVELALDVAVDEPLTITPWPENKVLDTQVLVSPLVWCLNYRYPVHRISQDYCPLEAPEQSTQLLVYRDNADQVVFMEVNPVTQALIQLLRDNPKWRLSQVLEQLATQMQIECNADFQAHALTLLQQLQQRDIVQAVDL